MALFDSPLVTFLMIDWDTKVERPAKSILMQNGWAYLQDGRYVVGSPLVVNDGAKTQLTFDLAQLAYADSSNLQLNYNQSNNRFYPTEIKSCYLVHLRFKVKPSANSGHIDLVIESPTVSFNPIVSETMTFAKSAGDEHFFYITSPLFISQDVITNGLTAYVIPHGTNISLYDYSVLVQKTYIP